MVQIVEVNIPLPQCQGDRKKFWLTSDFDFDFDFDLEKSMNTSKLRFIIPEETVPPSMEKRLNAPRRLQSKSKSKSKSTSQPHQEKLLAIALAAMQGKRIIFKEQFSN